MEMSKKMRYTKQAVILEMIEGMMTDIINFEQYAVRHGGIDTLDTGEIVGMRNQIRWLAQESWARTRGE